MLIHAMRYQNLLFLDFDGVLHPNLCIPDLYFGCSDPLFDLLAEREVGIVISSSWRHHHVWPDLIAIFPSMIQHRIIGATGPAVSGRHARYQEIRAYLANCPSSTSWRVLDDCAWEFPDHCPELILCNGATGVAEKQLQALASWLAHSSG
jgi:hypothetical protein